MALSPEDEDVVLEVLRSKGICSDCVSRVLAVLQAGIAAIEDGSGLEAASRVGIKPLIRVNAPEVRR